METVRCQSDQSTYATAITNICFVDTNAMKKILQGFSFISHIASEELIFLIF